MTDLNEVSLNQQIVALRHFPPGFNLFEHISEPEKEVLSDLLRISDDINILQWLKDNRSQLIARVLLWKELSDMSLMFQGLSNANQYSQKLSANYQHWLDKWSDSPEAIGLLQELPNSHPLIVKTEVLIRVLSSLQRAHSQNKRDVDSTIPESRSGVDPETPLNDLLQLPVTTDPVQWLETHYSHIAAIETIRYILSRVRPSKDLWGERVLKEYHPNQRIKTKGLSISLEKVTLGTKWFTLTLRGNISQNSLPQQRGNLSLAQSSRWNAHESIRDSLGYHYMICYRLEEGGRDFRGFNFSLKLLCFPAIAPTATEVAINSQESSFAVVSFQPDSYRPTTIHEIGFDNISWRINLTGK